MQLVGWLIHLVNVDKYVSDIGVTWPGLIGGFLQAVIYTYIGAYLFAWLHNRFLKNSFKNSLGLPLKVINYFKIAHKSYAIFKSI